MSYRKLALDENIIFQMYSWGNTISQIAEEFKVSKPTIVKRLGNYYDPERDIFPEQYTQRKDITCEKVIKLDRQGYSIREISEDLKCSKSLIVRRKQEYIRKYGSLHV
jgi:transposase